MRTAAAFDVEERKLVAHEGSIPEDQTLLVLLAGPFSNPVVSNFRDMVSSWSIYHDVHVDQGATLRQAAVARVDRRVAADGHNLIPVLHTFYTGDREFKRTLDDAMRVAFSEDYEELPIVAEHAVAASERTQVILTTHSTQLLDAFTDTPPTTTVAQWKEGETHLAIVDREELARWLQTYSLGALFRTGELEGMV